MGTSDVQIAKLALQHIGDRWDLTSLNDQTPEAEQVNLVFDNARRALLAEHPWKFAKTYYNPPRLSGTPPANWPYMFSYPPNGVRVWRIEDPLGRNRPPLPFDVLRAVVGNASTKVLVAETMEPEFMYTADITSAVEFSPHFELALSWRIAEMIAMPLTQSEEIKARVENDAEQEIRRAKDVDGNEGIWHNQSRDPDWIEARK